MVNLRTFGAAARWRLSGGAHRSARWVRQAVATAGPERHACVQSAKAGVAAVVSWLVAAEVLGLPQPFLAPYAAIYLVEVTVYRSVLSSVQQVVAVAAGVLLAGLAHALLPMAVGVALVTAIGLLLGQWHRLGPNGTWIAVTALLVLTFGTANDGPLLVDRLVETALGAAVGTAVNALLWPPTYRARAGRATEHAGAELAGLLGDMAAALRGGEPPGSAGDWIERALRARDAVRDAAELTGLIEENRKLSPRPATDPRQSAEARYRHAVRVLDETCPHIRQLADSIGSAAANHGPLTYPAEQARTGLADLLDGLAEAVRLVAAHQYETAEIELRLNRCRTRLDELDAHISGSTDTTRTALVGLAAMTLPIRRATHELSR